MSKLAEYVLSHTMRNACRCGKCVESGESNTLPPKHTVNMFFFDVCETNNPNQKDFLDLVANHRGEFVENLTFDKEVSYIEVGGWIGDQGVSLQLMALGSLLGVWDIMHPGMILNLKNASQKALADQMAGMGMVSVIPKTNQ